MALLAVFGLRTLYLSVKPLPRIELSEKELRLLGVSPSHAPQKKVMHDLLKVMLLEQF